jgi:hypothetical protein
VNCGATIVWPREGTDVYFIANRSAGLVEAACTFRVAGLRPELWDPLTGAIRDLPEYAERLGRTAVPMRFASHQGFFVIFRRASTTAAPRGSRDVNFPPAKRAVVIGGTWDVSFDPELGGPKFIQFRTLEDWSRRSEPGIKYYSGIATYRKTFDLPHFQSGGKAVKDTGFLPFGRRAFAPIGPCSTPRGRPPS